MDKAFETFRVLGTTDEVTACDCCGKAPLKMTVALSFDDGEPVYYGTTCAARAAKVAPAMIRSAIRKVENEAHEAKLAADRAKARASLIPPSFAIAERTSVRPVSAWRNDAQASNSARARFLEKTAA